MKKIRVNIENDVDHLAWYQRCQDIYKVKDGFPVWPARLSLIKLFKIKWWDVLTNIRL